MPHRATTFGSLTLHACALGALLAGGGARAAASDGPAWTFGGYGSAGVVYADTDQADFSANILKADGAGYSGRWSPSVDSRLGAQLGVTLDKQWSAVLQVVSEQRLDGSYRPQVEWANVKYQVTPDLALRVGRIALPVFLAADYRKVGYAYPTVRTPVEVYGAVPISNSDGADLSYRWRAGGFKYVTQVVTGRSELKLLDENVVKARQLNGVSQTAESGALSGRISVFTGELTINIGDDLFGALRQFGPAGVALADKYEIDHKRFGSVTVGATYDPGGWFATAELGRFNSRSFLGKTQTLYLGAGYRAGDWTPYASWAAVDARSAASDPGLPAAGLPPPLAGAVGAINAGLNTLLRSVPAQTTLSTGVRWDFRPDMALKLQYDRVKPREGSNGTLINVQPGFVSGRTVHVASAVLDFVF